MKSFIFSVLAVLIANVVFINTSQAGYDPDVECVQQALADAGYNPGPIDGDYGSKTQNAADEYFGAKTSMVMENPFSPETADEWCLVFRPPATIIGNDASKLMAPGKWVGSWKVGSYEGELIYTITTYGAVRLQAKNPDGKITSWSVKGNGVTVYDDNSIQLSKIFSAKESRTDTIHVISDTTAEVEYRYVNGEEEILGIASVAFQE